MRALEGARRIRDEARAMPAREAARAILRAYDENDLLVFANAIAFRLLFATIPLMLFGVGLAGALGLSEAWSRDAAPELQPKVSPAAFELIDDTVQKVLEEARVFWMTAGFAIALYAMSGGMRAVMDVFDRIYDADDERPLEQRIVISVLLALATGGLVLTAVAVVQIAPELLGDGWLGGTVSALRWPIAVALLSATVAVLMRYAPSESHPGGYVTFGSLITVAVWLGTSLAFAWYLTSVADYGSVYGALATVIIALQYLYLAALAFLTGAQLDALVRERLEGDAGGNG